MESPFPGMDPYLEAPSLWPNVHHRMTSGISDALVPLVAPRYFVGIEERVYLCKEDDPARKVVVPDALIREPEAVYEVADRPSGGVAAVPVQVLLDEEIREYWIAVRTADDERVVTVIELLSPTNKTVGSEGRKAYMAKRREWLRSEAHFIEIDLLRAGTPPPLSGRMVPSSHYRVLLSRVVERPEGQLWGISLRDPLPTIPVPLAGNDPDVPLDLQSALKDGYARARFDLRVDYTTPPPPPELTPEDKAWLVEQRAK